MAGNNMCVDSRHGKYELKIYWDDEVTVECRYFLSIEDAQDYVEQNGIKTYIIAPNI